MSFSIDLFDLQVNFFILFSPLFATSLAILCLYFDKASEDPVTK